MLVFGEEDCESNTSPCVSECLWFLSQACWLCWPPVWCQLARRFKETQCGFGVSIQSKQAPCERIPTTTGWCTHERWRTTHAYCIQIKCMDTQTTIHVVTEKTSMETDLNLNLSIWPRSQLVSPAHGSDVVLAQSSMWQMWLTDFWSGKWICTVKY